MRKVTMVNPPAAGSIIRHPALAITFDDGNITEYTEAFIYMHERNIRGTLYAVSSYVDTANFVTSAQLTEMYAAGWDIGNHTSDHSDLATLTLEEIKTKILDASNWLDARGLTRSSKHVCYPFGSYNATVLRAMDELNMLTGRTIVEQMESVSLDAVYEIKAYQLNAAKTLNTLKSYVDTAISQSRLAVVYIHAINTNPVSYDLHTTNFRAFIDYVISTGIRTVTMSELYRSKYVLP